MQFKGTCASGGKAEGNLCIVHDFREIDHCKKNDVVLLVKIKPTIPLIKMSSAILAIHGGVTSHAAIIARENNKPAIVSLSEEILQHVKNGDRVEVDADSGVVNIL